MNGLPEILANEVIGSLASLGDITPIRQTLPVGGGCIHHVLCLVTDQNRYLLKWNSGDLAATFSAEAEGLRLLRTAQAIRIPEVFTQGRTRQGNIGFLLLEWIESAAGARTPDMTRLGEQLAALHRFVPENGQPAYGLDQNNYIGANPQYNGWDTDWVHFFSEKRLLPQIELAGQNGYLPDFRRQRLERVLSRLDSWLAGVPRQPSLLHGDLWGGNVLAGSHQEPVLIDPAVYFGDREAELAFTELFGGFSNQFYQAYRAGFPLSPGYSDRRDLYNLYHLLNHLNLFGEGYGADVDQICRHYAG